MAPATSHRSSSNRLFRIGVTLKFGKEPCGRGKAWPASDPTIQNPRSASSARMPNLDKPREFSGFLNLNKPAGLTSRDVVDRVLRSLPRRTKAGHAGTLDPLATGVLVVAIGPGTRLIEAVQAQAKVYRTVVRLGACSDTLDADGAIEETPNPPRPTETDIQTALAPQIGTIEQVPPAYSALKVQGKRAYDLARSGQNVTLEPRKVRIDRIDVQNYEWPLVELVVACGAGTYIRSIARDLGESLGCGGLVQVLTRTRIGRFRIEDAVDPDRLSREHPRTPPTSFRSRHRLAPREPGRRANAPGFARPVARRLSRPLARRTPFRSLRRGPVRPLGRPARPGPVRPLSRRSGPQARARRRQMRAGRGRAR